MYIKNKIISQIVPRNWFTTELISIYIHMYSSSLELGTDGNYILEAIIVENKTTFINYETKQAVSVAKNSPN